MVYDNGLNKEELGLKEKLGIVEFDLVKQQIENDSLVSALQVVYSKIPFHETGARNLIFMILLEKGVVK